MKKNDLQLFAGEFDNNTYCNFDSAPAKAIAGKDIILAIWDKTGTSLMAISGQQGLTINRSRDSIEITSKDLNGDWKEKISGIKEWSIDNDGIYAINSASHQELAKYFDSGDPVCVKVYNKKLQKGMFGGLAIITDYPIEAPYDDSATYSLTLDGTGGLIDFSIQDSVTPDGAPEGYGAPAGDGTEGGTV